MRAFLLIFIAGSICTAEVYFVPENFPTIQTALNTIGDSDSIYVDVGIYAEALQAPPLTFALLGNVIPDTGDYPRPIVDPSTLSDPTTLTCLTLPPESRVTVEDFIFRNGPEMFPHEEGGTGGVLNNSHEARFTRCVFDSTYRGLYPNAGVLTVSDCDFRNISRHAIHNGLTDSLVTARRCRFSKVPGSGGSCIVLLNGPSLVEDCWFKEYEGTSLLNISGAEIVVQNCLFGDASSLTSEALNGSNLSHCLIEGNVFRDLEVQSAVAALSFSFGQGDTSYVSENYFVNDTAIFPAGGGLGLGQTERPFNVVVENNVFDHCLGGNTFDHIESDDAIIIRHNRFIGGSETAAPSYLAGNHWNAPILRDNLFIHTGVALNSVQLQTDASWNWWGDPTGPYHMWLNPEGSGDTVVGGVNIDPWYSDTLFYNEATAVSPPLPDRFQLEVYPNPFNSSVRIILAGFTGRDFEVTLHNLLGQVVDVIHRGPMTGGEITYQAPAYLASGVYFIRATDRIAVQTRKVVLLK